jgi:hypothetical protein
VQLRSPRSTATSQSAPPCRRRGATGAAAASPDGGRPNAKGLSLMTAEAEPPHHARAWWAELVPRGHCEAPRPRAEGEAEGGARAHWYKPGNNRGVVAKITDGRSMGYPRRANN